MKYGKIIDISQPVTSKTACFPGDVPFSRSITLTYEDTKIVNLSSFTTSPHVGTHTDAPSHIKGSYADSDDLIGAADLTPFVGDAIVVDLSPYRGEIIWEQVQPLLEGVKVLPERILFKTQKEIRNEVFEDEYAYFSPGLIKELSQRSIRLMGIDTPSVDHVRAKTLIAHNALHNASMVWIENLDLTAVESGLYWLIALPLKYMELEASPVRAVLLK